MDQTYFLAANTGQGFYSLYDAFPGKGRFLHIIKGGPGTGKSGFMRSLREAARSHGLDTVSVLCSGDPDSLDGLLLPALGLAWVDGTAPHIREPRLFGVDSDYVNLGCFCRLPLDARDREQALSLNRAYKARYAEAYQQLEAAAALEAQEELPDAAVMQEEVQRVQAILDAYPDREGVCATEKRFLSAISCQGMLHLDGEIEALCKQVVALRGGSAVLEQAAEMAKRKGTQLLLCPRPLCPGQLEAVLLPELSLAFLRSPAALMIPQGERLLSGEALDHALESLREAKALHDRLEAVYKPYMDFEALTAFTDEYVSRLFP